MNSFELNKIMGALLATCLAVLSLNIASGAIFSQHKPEKPGFDIAVKETNTGGAGGDAAPSAQPIEVLLAASNAEKGAASAKKCTACHTFEKGGPNKVGPNLYGVVNRPKASEAGFNYSAPMKGKGGNWSYDDLNHFLASPKGFVPGTAMSFAGLTRDSERADVINYLHTLADNPGPLPKAAEAAPNNTPQDQNGAPQPQQSQPANSGAQQNAPSGSAPPRH